MECDDVLMRLTLGNPWYHPTTLRKRRLPLTQSFLCSCIALIISGYVLTVLVSGYDTIIFLTKSRLYEMSALLDIKKNILINKIS